MTIDRTRASECGSKHKHTDKAEALRHRASLVKGGAFAKRLTVYRCKHCDAWHVGHRPEPKRNRR